MKRYVFLLIALFFVIGVMGETDVSVQEAQEISVSYYSQVRDITKEYCNVGTPERISLLGLAEMWIVPVNDSWILVSTDKRTEAILARFTTQEKPDLKTYPPAAQYNKFCPNINTNMQYLCGHAVAGCVAIAVAQIMRYWEWPYAADVPTTIGGSTKVKNSMIGV